MWQDIETAPKDGTRILAWDGKNMTVVTWYDPRGGVTGWWDLEVAGSYAEDSYFDATHWQPAPNDGPPLIVIRKKEQADEHVIAYQRARNIRLLKLEDAQRMATYQRWEDFKSFNRRWSEDA